MLDKQASNLVGFLWLNSSLWLSIRMLPRRHQIVTISGWTAAVNSLQHDSGMTLLLVLWVIGLDSDTVPSLATLPRNRRSGLVCAFKLVNVMPARSVNLLW